MMYINADGCGACEPVCPVEVICYEDDVPAAMQQFIAAGQDFYGALGDPGGAVNVGRQSHDAGPAAIRR